MRSAPHISPLFCSPGLDFNLSLGFNSDAGHTIMDFITQIPLDAICKEFDIRAEEVFAFMDEENIDLGGGLMHNISMDMRDFRKFIKYYRRQLNSRIEKTRRDLDNLDGQVDSFLKVRQAR